MRVAGVGAGHPIVRTGCLPFLCGNFKAETKSPSNLVIDVLMVILLDPATGNSYNTRILHKN
ncbi:MAG: hypothetical protein BA867_12615 [Desulfobacterales bacterium S5133MH16]|nr:MAG: hypothetical protein BA867_12615 [Desulfobacterales bacterium S5133MH16]